MKLLGLSVLSAIVLANGFPMTRQSLLSKELLTPSASSRDGRSKDIRTKPEAGSARTELNDQISVQASGRGRPWINLGDGHELLSDYDGAANLVAQMKTNQATPVSATAADLDGDGVPDLLSGFAGRNGGGIVAVSRGNMDAIYPNSRDALARKKNGTFSTAPFLSPVRLFQTPSAPDFIEPGDFDADGNSDVAFASRGGSALYLMQGDGAGGLDEVKKIDLPGQVTAMASGDINRRDGLTDLLVGLDSTDGAKLMVFESPKGALRGTPEVISLPGPAAAISVGYLYNRTYADVAVISGRFLVTVQGRDRQLSLDAATRENVPPPVVSKQSMPDVGGSITIGKFTGDETTQAAVLMDDGRLGLFAAAESGRGKLHQMALTRATEGNGRMQPRLVKARVSGRAGDDLIVVDQAESRLRVLFGGAAPGASAEEEGFPSSVAPADLLTDQAPIAVLPMRLNVSARNDLVVIRRGSVNASVVPAQFDNVFTVTTTGDDFSGSASGTTLRDVIVAAQNAPQGSSNEIAFSIDQSGVPSLNVEGPLPTLPEGSSVAIDGTTQAQVQGVAMVGINGEQNTGLMVQGFNDVVRGLVIRNTAGPVNITQSNNIVEGNTFGTFPDGVTPSANTGSGVFINHGSDNLVGGTASPAANVIGVSHNDGITITNRASGNMVFGNFVGVDQALQVKLSNGGNGIQVEDSATATTIGTPGAANFFDFNGADGIAIASGTNHLLTNNASQGNAGNGISVNGAASTTIGGAQGGQLGNGFWQNAQNGILIASGSTSIQAQGNAIGVAFSNGNASPFPNALDGVSISASGNLIGGSDVSLGNSIAFNGNDGVAVVSGSGNAILSNVIAANSPGLPIHLSPGTNNNAQPPEISGATVSGGSVPTPSGLMIQTAAIVPNATSPVMVISFVFKSTPNRTFNLQFYVPQICNCTNCFTNVGIYSMQVTTDGNGNAPSPVTITLNSEPATGSFVNATATDSGNNTSQFSECVQIGSATACEYQLSSASEEVGSGGGSGSFMVITTSNCPYNATDSDPWVHITSGSGLGSGTVSFTADPNPGDASRQSTISVAPGLDFTLVEEGTGPDFLLSLNPNSISGPPGSVIPVTVMVSRAGGFSGAVTVTPPSKANGIKIKPTTSKKLKGSNSSFVATIKVTAGAAPGTYSFTFNASGSGVSGTRTAALSVTVQ